MDVEETDISLPSFYAPDIGAMKTTNVGESFLRKPAALAKFPQCEPEG
jgi:hypothetical protein